MKSILPIAATIVGLGALVYIYVKQRDKDKKKKPDSDNNNGISSDDTKTVETLEFQVENYLVPLIVGRNSVNLKSIEQKTKTNIKFRECDDDHQMCTISGSASDVKNAKQLIDIEAKKQPIITDELLVPMSSCGKIEGYCGSVLQEICQKSSAKVWVDPGVKKVQGENRRVLISGTKEQVEAAKALIEEKIKEPNTEQPSQVDEKKDVNGKSPSPYASNSSITTTDTPREVMLPSPEKLKNNDGPLEVYVSSVVSPSRFWVQICGPQLTEFDLLSNAINDYYSIKENQELHAIREPYLGQIVAAMFLGDNKWYRAEIVEIKPNRDDLAFDVYFLDYGDQQYVGRKDILELRADFLSLRFQAIECFLAYVQPINTGSKFEEWDRQAIAEFEKIVMPSQWKKMKSKVVTYKERKSFALQRQSNNKRESSPIPGVELYEEDSDRSIALDLINLGCAEMSDRFGDLAKSPILTVIDDNKKGGSKETTPEPKQDLTEPPMTVPIPERPQKVEEEPVKIKPEPSAPIKIPGSISLEPSEPKESKKPEPQLVVEDIAPPQDDIPNKVDNHELQPSDDDQQAVTNGQSKNYRPEPSPSFTYGAATNGKQMKPKKKKQQATADFLKGEQGNAPKKHKNVDWNAMMDD